MWHLLKRLFGMKSSRRSETGIYINDKEIIGVGSWQTSVLSTKPGDMLVLQTDRKLSFEQCERVKKAFEMAFTGTPKIPIIVLEEGLKLGIIRPEKEVQSNERDTKDLPSEGTTSHET
jgi:hypothetical protein